MANTSATSGIPGEITMSESYADLQEQVRLRAYEIYEKRGREDGHALEDWLQAQSEILAAGVKVVLVSDGVRLVA